MSLRMLNASGLLGSHDVLFVTLDTLRYDVAARLYRDGRTPQLAAALPPGGWEKRHSPGSFTFAAHAAFFAGFLPTPAHPGPHPRPFALRFPGSATTTEQTAVFDSSDLVSGFRERGYRTICVGGVGFFNKLTPLGRVLPALFDESHWSPELGVSEPRSTEHQVGLALRRVADQPPNRRVFLFVNVSAIHQPNCFYLSGAAADCLESHAAWAAARGRTPAGSTIHSATPSARGELRRSSPTTWPARPPRSPSPIYRALDFLLGEGAIVQRGIPMAQIDGQNFDVRVVCVYGRPVASIFRLSSIPMTNLHLGGRRGNFGRCRAVIPTRDWLDALEQCGAAATCFPSAVAGVDLLFEPGFGRHSVLEVNAFGDFFPGWTNAQGRSLHALEIEETARRFG